VTLTPTMSPGSIGIGIIASSAELCERELIKLASLSSERVSGGWCCACASGSGGLLGRSLRRQISDGPEVHPPPRR
jgi:hypothetical protein